MRLGPRLVLELVSTRKYTHTATLRRAASRVCAEKCSWGEQAKTQVRDKPSARWLIWEEGVEVAGGKAARRKRGE